MKWLMSRMGLIPAVMDALRKSPATTAFPKSEVVLPESYRGEIEFFAERCTGCGLCVRDCPAEALFLEKKSRDHYRLVYYPARCAYCGQCEESCRNHAIGNKHRLVKAKTNIEDWIQILKEK